MNINSSALSKVKNRLSKRSSERPRSFSRSVATIAESQNKYPSPGADTNSRIPQGLSPETLETLMFKILSDFTTVCWCVCTPIWGEVQHA